MNILLNLATTCTAAYTLLNIINILVMNIEIETTILKLTVWYGIMTEDP